MGPSLTYRSSPGLRRPSSSGSNRGLPHMTSPGRSWRHHARTAWSPGRHGPYGAWLSGASGRCCLGQTSCSGVNLECGLSASRASLKTWPDATRARRCVWRQQLEGFYSAPPARECMTNRRRERRSTILCATVFAQVGPRLRLFSDLSYVFTDLIVTGY